MELMGGNISSVMCERRGGVGGSASLKLNSKTKIHIGEDKESESTGEDRFSSFVASC